MPISLTFFTDEEKYQDFCRTNALNLSDVGLATMIWDGKSVKVYRDLRTLRSDSISLQKERDQKALEPFINKYVEVCYIRYIPSANRTKLDWWREASTVYRYWAYLIGAVSRYQMQGIRHAPMLGSENEDAFAELRSVKDDPQLQDLCGNTSFLMFYREFRETHPEYQAYLQNIEDAMIMREVQQMVNQIDPDAAHRELLEMIRLHSSGMGYPESFRPRFIDIPPVSEYSYNRTPTANLSISTGDLLTMTDRGYYIRANMNTDMQKYIGLVLSADSNNNNDGE